MKNLQKETIRHQRIHLAKWVALVIFIMLAAVCTGYAQTRQQVHDYCVEIGIHRPEFVTKQVMYETGHLDQKSLGCRQNNFLCFRWGSFLEFDCWQSSLNYYKCWMERKGIYFYKDLETLLINEWGAKDMKGYVETVKRVR